MNRVRHLSHRESIAGRFDAEADALQSLLARAVGREGHAHRIDLDRRPAGDRRTCVRAQPRATSSDDPIGRCAPIDLPCQRHDPDLWFADAPADLQLAKALCADCPARLACLAGAAARQEPTGVWGGQIFDHGRIVTHKRSRGRPRKDSTPPRSHRVLPADVAGAHSSGPSWLALLACRDSDLDMPDLADHRVGEDIDQIAVERAVAGYHQVRLHDLTRAEQDEVICRLTERGESARDIADQLATTERTVCRRRAALNLTAATLPDAHRRARPTSLTH